MWMQEKARTIAVAFEALSGCKNRSLDTLGFGFCEQESYAVLDCYFWKAICMLSDFLELHHNLDGQSQPYASSLVFW